MSTDCLSLDRDAALLTCSYHSHVFHLVGSSPSLNCGASTRCVRSIRIRFGGGKCSKHDSHIVEVLCSCQRRSGCSQCGSVVFTILLNLPDRIGCSLLDGEIVIDCGLVSPAMPENTHICSQFPCYLCGRSDLGPYVREPRCSEVTNSEGPSPASYVDEHADKAPDLNPFDNYSPFDMSPSDMSEGDDESKDEFDLPRMFFEHLSIDNSTKTQALDQMETSEKKYPNSEPGIIEYTLQLQRAWIIHSAWASIENVCKISRSVLVNKLQCEHIASHFQVIGDVLMKLGLGKDFVSGQAFEGNINIQINFTFDETCFNHIAKTFEDNFYGVEKTNSNDYDFFSGSLIKDTSSMFEDYIHALLTMDASSEESLSKKFEINEGFKDYSLQRMNTKENVEARSYYHKQHRLDQFLCLLLGVLNEGKDLVLFHSGLKGANNGVVKRTGMCGEKFVEIHEFLYELLDFYACFDHCEGTEFGRDYLSQCDSCRSQSLLYYLNSNCLGETTSLSINKFFLNIKLATTLSELLERPNCVLKTLSIQGPSLVKFDQVELQEIQKCYLMVITALSKCMSLTSLTVRSPNGEEVHDLCKSLSSNKALENLVMWIDGPLADNSAMDLSIMLKKNHSLKSFSLASDNISSKGATYFGVMLAKNFCLEELSIQCSALDEISMRHFMWPLITNMDGESQVNLSLKHLHIDIIDECPPGVVEIIAQLLHTNKTLAHFSIEFKDLDPGATCKILDSLKINRTLQVLDLLGWSSCDNDFEVATCLKAMLAENSTLQELKVDTLMWDAYCMKHLLSPLMANEDGKPHVNISLKRLHILNYISNGGGKDLVESIAQMLCTNKTLSHFSMINASLEPLDVCMILDSLKINKVLQVLNLQGWSSSRNNSKVATCLEAMLVENSSLEELKVDTLMWDKLCLKHLLRPLMASKDGKAYVNNSLKRLHILDYNSDGSWEVVESIVEMLRTNKTLNHFSIINACLSASNICLIVDSLKNNKALQVLDLNKCTGLDDPRVKIAFMDLLVNYNFTLHTIKMHGRDWDIEAFMKFELELDTIMSKRRLMSLVGGICEFPTTHNVGAYDSKQVLEDFQLERGEGSSIEVHESSLKAYREHQEELVGGCPSHRKKLLRLQSKLEMESKQSLHKLKPILESVMKSTNFLLQRNLNMAQLLQERYTQWNTFVEMYPFKWTYKEKDEINKGCNIAMLFPTTFLYHLKARLLQGPNPRGIPHMLKEVVSLVVERMKSLQDFGSQTFEFIDYVDVQASLDVEYIHSPRETIAICQTFSTRTRIGEELQVENFIQYGIVQDHLTGAYYVDSNKALNLDNLNLDKSTGVIGVKVTSSEIHVEIIWEDGSYYFGALEDFSYDLELDDNKQCALAAFGDLKGAHFLTTCGLKCSPLLVFALAMAIHKKGLSLKWKKGKGHIQIYSTLPSEQPTELEVWECQILFSGDINQLGDAVEWGMNQFDCNCASSSRIYSDNQSQVALEHDLDRNMHISNISNDTSMDTWIPKKYNDTSSHTQSNATGNRDLSALAAQFSAGVQSKQKLSIGVKVLGSGGDISFERQYSKGEEVKNQSYKKMQELHWKEEGGYFRNKLNDRHKFLEEELCQGSLYAKRDLNYFVVYDGCRESHVSIYWVKESSDEPRLELEWITDIFIKKGLEEIKSIFKGLKGETLEVTRTGTEYLETPLQQQSKGLMKWFINRHSNKSNCKGTKLQMVSIFEGHSLQIPSNGEWEHIVGLQPDICSNEFWWKASYMQAITYSRTRYTSGLLLSTHTFEEYELKCGSASRKSRVDQSNYVHDSTIVKACGKFSKPPQSLSSRWHDMINWGGFRKTLV